MNFTYMGVMWSYETDDNMLNVAVSADGEYIVTGSHNFKVYLFDKDSNTPLWNYTADLDQGGYSIGEVSISALGLQLYGSTSPQGIRATVYDHTANVYGLVEGTNIAQRPLDNFGVQYGLRALNTLAITPQQFINLNRDIGGFDHDMNHVSERHRADPGARKRALESGRILNGGAGLSQIPIIDYRSYLDDALDGNIHMLVHQFSTRQRLLNQNGQATNHVMQIGG